MPVKESIAVSMWSGPSITLAGIGTGLVTLNLQGEPLFVAEGILVVANVFMSLGATYCDSKRNLHSWIVSIIQDVALLMFSGVLFFLSQPGLAKFMPEGNPVGTVAATAFVFVYLVRMIAYLRAMGVSFGSFTPAVERLESQASIPPAENAAAPGSLLKP